MVYNKTYDFKLRNLKISFTTNFIEQSDNKSKAFWYFIKKGEERKKN